MATEQTSGAATESVPGAATVQTGEAALQTQYIQYARQELTQQMIYNLLAQHEKNPDNRGTLEKMALQEKSHYEFWSALAAPATAEIKPLAAALWQVKLMRQLLGITFTIKFLEQKESGDAAAYDKFSAQIPAENRERLRAIISDEENHEQTLINRIKEKRVAYIGFIVLGLSDAIIEITGVHAGFLGVTGLPLMAGVAGVIVGFAGAISMASAAYLQAKQNTEVKPWISAVSTGVSYLFSVVLLAFPYFVINTMLTSFVVSTGIGIALIAGFSYYGAIVFERNFLREFLETSGLALVTAAATFFVGGVVGRIFNVKSLTL